METSQHQLAIDSQELGAKTKPRRRCSRGSVGLLVVVILMLAVCVILASVFTFRKKARQHSDEQYEHAAVATDSAECSIIGRDILQQGGTAADATVAFTICLGVYVTQSNGIGGGNFILYYDRATEDFTFFDGREVAPLAATATMYDEHPKNSTIGGLAIGVPGVISSLWDLHRQYGKLDWADLFAPSIDRAKNGFVVPTALGISLSSKGETIDADPELRELFVKESGCREEDVRIGTSECLVNTGDEIVMPKLADTLEKIAAGGRDAFYSGDLAEDIAADIADRGGIITKEDLEMYTTTVKDDPLEFTLGDLKAVTGNPPAGGAVIALILNILQGYGFTPDDLSTKAGEVLTYHRMIEAFKFAFAKRSALGDEDFVDVEQLVSNLASSRYADTLRAKISDDVTHTYDYYEPVFQAVDDHGTSHSSIVDADGNACAITGTLNWGLGSKVVGSRTGIVFNNEMNDFSTPGARNAFGFPPSASNFIEPGKRPLSSMSPIILTDSEGHVTHVLGASGGRRIITGVAAAIMHMKWFGVDLVNAIERPRLHDQLVPTEVHYEASLDEEVVARLAEKGHNMTERVYTANIQGITRLEDNWLQAHCDSRKGASPAGY